MAARAQDQAQEAVIEEEGDSVNRCHRLVKNHREAGRWLFCDISLDFKFVQRRPGVYAIYSDASLVYIGMSYNVRTRLLSHGLFNNNFAERVPNCGKITVKIKYSKRYGDWAMWELRLLNRLRPPMNGYVK